MNDISDKILLFFQRLNSPLLEKIFLYSTKIVEQEFLIIFLSFVLWTNKNLGYEIAYLFFSSSLVVQCLKIIFHFPRPFNRNTNIIPNKRALKNATGYSFPSAHTQTSIAIFIIAYKYSNYNIFLIIIGLIALSRVVLRVHNIYDVIASIIITTIIYLFLNILSANTKFIFLNILTIISFIYLIYTSIKNRDDIEFNENIVDAFKSLGATLGFIFSLFINKVFFNINNINLTNTSVLVRTAICIAILGWLFKVLNDVFRGTKYLKILQFFIFSTLMFLITPLFLNY